MLIQHLTSQQYISKNSLGSDYFVGDIHGEINLLKCQLKRLNFNVSTDRLFAVGDIIDRGPHSIECIRLLMQPWFFSVLGNHEEMLLKGFESPHYWQSIMDNGGQWLSGLLATPEDLWQLAQLIRIKMPLSMEVKTTAGTIGVTHANTTNIWHHFKNTTVIRRKLLWSREIKEQLNIEPTVTVAPIKNISLTIHGHNNLQHIATVNNQICLDTLLKTNKLSIISAQTAFELIKKQ